MKRELENKLAEEFPFMLRKHSLAEQRNLGYISDLYGAFGCDCADGWYELIRSLCREITETYEKHGRKPDIIIDQVKEKYGTLRFYYHIEEDDTQIHAIDIMSVDSLRIKNEKKPLYEEIDELVEKYEKMSATVCEECGRTGKLRLDLGWILTLCDDCYSKRVDMRRKRIKK